MTKFKVYGQEVNMGDQLPPIPSLHPKQEVIKVTDDNPNSDVSRWSKMARIGAKALVPGAMLGAGIVAAGCESTPPSTTVVASETTSTTNEQQEALTVESLKLDPSLINDPQALAEAWFQRTNQWLNAGATPENAEQSLYYSGDWEETATNFTGELDVIFEEALISKAALTDSSVQEVISNIKYLHNNVLALYFATVGRETPYVRETKVDKIISSSANPDGSLVIEVMIHDIDNANMNSVGEDLTGYTSIDTLPSTSIMTFRVEDNRVVLSDIILDSSN